VLHLSASFPRTDADATAPFLADLVAAQDAAGWDVSVVAAHDAGLPSRNRVAGVEVRRARYAPDRFEVLVYRGGGHGGLQRRAHALLLPGLALALLIATVDELRRRRPQVLHAHWLLPGAVLAALVPRRLRGRLVVTMHGTDVELARSPVGRLLAKLVVRRADALLAVSEPLARDAEGVLGLAAGAVRVARLPLPRDLVPVPLPPLDQPLRLLAAGRASREKGFDVLVAALALPKAERWSATIVAAGPERDRLVASVRAAGLDSRVELLPLMPRADLHALMAEHHLVVVPSRTEGLGMFALEALAGGRPVIASAVGGLREVVAEPADGMLIPADDPDALAAALDEIDLRPPTASAAERHRAAAIVDQHRAAYGW
jgi:glycosyltransferase involved in cell wall biosynthesis